MKPILRLRLTIFATVIGFFTLALYTTLVEDILFKGGVLQCYWAAVGPKTMGMMTAGLVTGFLTSLLVLQENYYANVILSLAVAIKVFLLVG